MHRIKNIIFDLGGVIYDIRYENIAESFVKYGIKDIGEFYSRNYQTPEMDSFEMGLMSPDDFRNYVREATHTLLCDNDIDAIINAILVDIPLYRVQLLLSLRQKYKVFLFSNTNQINYDYYSKWVVEKFSFDIFEACFDACYFSHFMHIRKPAVEGFSRIITEQRLEPHETVFIDDNMANVVGARKAGIRGYCLRNKDIVELFDEYNNPRFDLRRC